MNENLRNALIHETLGAKAAIRRKRPQYPICYPRDLKSLNDRHLMFAHRTAMQEATGQVPDTLLRSPMRRRRMRKPIQERK